MTNEESMEIEDKHKTLLLKLGLKEKDFKLFDGKQVTFEFQEDKGVRLYDPYYQTSYSEYIGVDGWSAWSSEEDRFMSQVLTAANKEVERREKMKPSQEEVASALEKKFSKKDR
jgi:hypothetical protein